MQKRILWIAIAVALAPRLAGSSTPLLSTEFRNALIAHEDTSIRIHHARELLGSHYAEQVPKGFHAEYDVSPYIYAIIKRHMKRAGSDAHRISDAIVQEGRKYRLDPVFILAVIQRESRFHPTKLGGHGEIGLMQIKPMTGRWIARKYNLHWSGKDTLLDPVMNVRIGAAYFDFLRTSFKSRGQLYLSAYNLGQQKTRETLKRGIYPREYSNGVLHGFLRFQAEMGKMARRRHAPRKAS
jgi:soluble lytic murein transglycosylase